VWLRVAQDAVKKGKGQTPTTRTRKNREPVETPALFAVRHLRV
jgi:hypothetical protein